MSGKNEITDWDDYYKDNVVEEMPWYHPDLDHDLENEIKSRKLNSGKFLDLGTGPGTQAIQLAKLGFDVTGADLSQNAIKKAKSLSDEINFVADDILNSGLPDKEFDYIFDRGCFHLFEDNQRTNYLKHIKRILSDDGIFFLKCMSIEEKSLPDDEGPRRLSKKEIQEFFSNDFEIENIRDTEFAGTLDFLPKALFAILKKKS